MNNEISIDANRINKVWTQAYRTKMASAVYKKVTGQVRQHWRTKLEKENENARKKLKREMNKWIKSMSKTLTKEFKEVNKESLQYFLEGQYNIADGGDTIDKKLDKLKIPTRYWHSDPDTPSSCIELLDSEITVLRDIGFTLLEFMRTGHRNEWVDVCDVTRAYDKAQKENK